MATAAPSAVVPGLPDIHSDVKIYSHSPLLYWWPVWVAGYLMALLTYIGGVTVEIGPYQELFHPSRSMGAIYTFIFFLVILITNVTLRGTNSVIAILSLVPILAIAVCCVWPQRATVRTPTTA